MEEVLKEYKVYYEGGYRGEFEGLYTRYSTSTGRKIWVHSSGRSVNDKAFYILEQEFKKLNL